MEGEIFNIYPPEESKVLLVAVIHTYLHTGAKRPSEQVLAQQKDTTASGLLEMEIRSSSDKQSAPRHAIRERAWRIMQ
jgi:hypothetical protein